MATWYVLFVFPVGDSTMGVSLLTQGTAGVTTDLKTTRYFSHGLIFLRSAINHKVI